MKFLSDQSDEQKQTVALLQESNTTLQQTVDSLQDQIDLLKLDLKEERKMRDNQEANGRQKCLEITGIPKATPEPKDLLRQRVLDICDVLSVPMTMIDIDDIHRKQNGEIIVLFRDRQPRKRLFDKRRTPQLEALRPSSFEHWPASDRGRRFYINESLTMDRSKAAAICRRKAARMNNQQNST